jgi:hypothetical protein
VRAVLAYVLLNARKHAGGSARSDPEAEPRLDPASSSRWFDGWARPAAGALDAPAVSPPRTWLLASGWLRHGRIDPGGVPGSRRHRRR